MSVWTAFCALKDDPPDLFTEEIDVNATSETEAIRKASEVIAEGGWVKGLEVRRVIERIPGFLFW